MCLCHLKTYIYFPQSRHKKTLHAFFGQTQIFAILKLQGMNVSPNKEVQTSSSNSVEQQ